MDRHTSRFVDYDDLLIFEYDPDGSSGDWRFVTVEGMRYDIAVLDNRTRGRYFLAVQDNMASFNGSFLLVYY